MKNYLIKIFVLATTVLMFFAYTISATDKKIGDIVDYTLYTDIIALIDDKFIDSYNINGRTVIIAENLINFGFNVIWDSQNRSLHIKLSDSYPNNDLKNSNNLNLDVKNTVEKKLIGTRAFPVLHTDIKCFLNEKQVKSFNIGGETIIYMNDLADTYKNSYIWNDIERTVKLELFSPWKISVINDNYDSEYKKLQYGFVFKFKKTSKNNDINFDIIKSRLDSNTIKKIDIDGKSIKFSIYKNITEYGEFYKDLSDIINIKYDERIFENTVERQAELFKIFRIYINESPVIGELSYIQGNGHADYIFMFKYNYNLENIKTIEIQLGY